jgi:uncharacterized protein (TIGR00369 family)
LSKSAAKSESKSRTRTVSWADPMISAGAVQKGASGIEFLQKIVSGEIPPPPIAVLMGFDITKVEPGYALFECDPAEYHYNPIGVVHGGLACTLLDSAMSCAIQTTVPGGFVYTTLELKVHLVRPVTDKTGHLRRGADHPWRRACGYGRGQAHRQGRQDLRARHHDVHDHEALILSRSPPRDKGQARSPSSRLMSGSSPP